MNQNDQRGQNLAIENIIFNVKFSNQTELTRLVAGPLRSNDLSQILI